MGSCTVHDSGVSSATSISIFTCDVHDTGRSDWQQSIMLHPEADCVGAAAKSASAFTLGSGTALGVLHDTDGFRAATMSVSIFTLGTLLGSLQESVSIFTLASIGTVSLGSLHEADVVDAAVMSAPTFTLSLIHI